MTAKTNHTQDDASERDQSRFENIGKTAFDVIQEASFVLEEELANGLIAARKVSQRFAEERRLEPEDFTEVLKRFRSTGHELIDAVQTRMTDELRSDTTQELSRRFLTDTKSAFDVFVDLIGTAPDLVNRFVNSNFPESKNPQPSPSNDRDR